MGCARRHSSPAATEATHASQDGARHRCRFLLTAELAFTQNMRVRRKQRTRPRDGEARVRLQPSVDTALAHVSATC